MATDQDEYVGCTDGGCVFSHPGGQHTNGGCKCLLDLPPSRRRVVQRALRLAKAKPEIVAALEAAERAFGHIPYRLNLSYEGTAVWHFEESLKLVRAALAKVRP